MSICCMFVMCWCTLSACLGILICKCILNWYHSLVSFLVCMNMFFFPTIFYLFIHTSIHACMHICTRAYIHTSTHTYIHTHIHASIGSSCGQSQALRYARHVPRRRQFDHYARQRGCGKRKVHIHIYTYICKYIRQSR